jgi:hypothetical protein
MSNSHSNGNTKTCYVFISTGESHIIFLLRGRHPIHVTFFILDELIWVGEFLYRLYNENPFCGTEIFWTC